MISWYEALTQNRYAELHPLQLEFPPTEEEILAKPCKGVAQDAALILEKLGCTLTYRFIPWSRSRNAKEKRPSLNWECTLSRGAHSYSFPYTKGQGHCHAYRNPIRFSDGRMDVYATKEAIRRECETGHKVTPPTLVEVCYSLFVDAYEGSFEGWCSEYGYSDDSIKAKAMYEKCCRTRHVLQRMFGPYYNSLLEFLSYM